MDEFGFLKRLNVFCAAKGEKRPMKVVMRSCSVNPKDILMVNEPGSDEYLQKPLTTDKVCSVINAYFHFPSFHPAIEHKKRREGTKR